MKLRSTLIALAFASPTAWSAGPFDGIYQLPSGVEWFTVHQNGGHMIVGNFWSYAGSVVQYTLNNGQVYLPDRTDNWDLYGGPINGSTAEVTGQTAFGACLMTLRFNFGPAPTFTIVAQGTTTRGLSQGINCAQVINNIVSRNGGVTVGLVKIF